MSNVVLRVKLVGSGQLDVVHDYAQIDDRTLLTEEAVSALTDPLAALRAGHGDRLMLLLGRGVGAVELAPRGAVLTSMIGRATLVLTCSA